jgi:hypothetical protein
VVGNPCLGGNPADLAGPLEVFADWLDGYAEVEEVWLPSIERNGPMRVQRMAYLKICGTISKHGITRLGGIVREIQKILSANGTEVDEGQAYLVVPEFQEWFQDHVFQYQATSIACFLNNIRWGIFEYLAPEFHRAFRPTWRRGILEAYRYELPAEIANPLIVSMYWDLLNHVRTEPYFPRFTVSPYLVGRY